jgi:hypothetical protein
MHSSWSTAGVMSPRSHLRPATSASSAPNVFHLNNSHTLDLGCQQLEFRKSRRVRVGLTPSEDDTQLVKKILAYSGTRSALSCSQDATRSHPKPVKCRPSSLILLSHLRLRIPTGPFDSVCPAKILYAFLISRIRATHLTPLILFDLIIIQWNLTNSEFAIVRTTVFFSLRITTLMMRQDVIKEQHRRRTQTKISSFF